MDIITYALAKSYINNIINNLPKGIVYRGAVDYMHELPLNAEIGDAYTVNYQGTSGSISDGGEYVWGTYNNVNVWIQLGPDISQYQQKITSTNQLSSDYVSDLNNEHKFVTNLMYEYLEEKLYQYPEIITFVFCDNNDTPINTTLEIGDNVVISKIKHCETNINNIKELTLNGQIIIPSSVDTIVTLDTPITVTSTMNKTLIGENTRNSNFSKTTTIYINTYDYTKVSDSNITPVNNLQKQTNSSYQISYEINNYIYFYSKSNNKIIQQKVGDQWIAVDPQTKLGKLNNGIVLNNGTLNTDYYGYVIGPFTQAGGTDTYRLN